MSVVVFWLAPVGESFSPEYEPCADTSVALKFCATLRSQGMHHVVISSEFGEQVGKMGVDAVVDGKTPDGHPYDWSKADRAGKARRR